MLLLIDLVTGNFSQLASDAANIWNNIRNAASQIWSAMKQTAYSVWNGIKATVMNIASALREAAVSAFQRMAYRDRRSSGERILSRGRSTGFPT